MSVENYLAARTEFTAVRGELQSLSAIMAEVATSLQQHPTRFIFANQPIALPMEATFARDSRSVDANAWPTVDKIMKTLERYHSAKSAVENGWNAIPQQQREGLRDPTDLVARR